MKGYKAAALLPPILAALAIVALTLYAYRDLPARPFAADDYQWLLNVRGLSFGEVIRKAFDPAAQTHFYRPLIWLLFWAQTRAFGLDPRGFHAVSLALHLLNAFLLGWLIYRLTKDERRTTNNEARYSWSLVVGRSSALLAMAIVALHPAPFEAAVWISSQSELLAAALLLVALHLWLVPRTKNRRSHLVILSSCHLVSAIALGLALLAKESAVIGLPLLLLLGRGGRAKNREPENRRTEEPRKLGMSNQQRITGNEQRTIPPAPCGNPPRSTTQTFHRRLW